MSVAVLAHYLNSPIEVEPPFFSKFHSSAKEITQTQKHNRRLIITH
jgi:hypothetical protein